ncbi:hypothetical protein [uncultured Sphingomonas sp.]|uniref:DUF6961 family protein n=1 Tax=uncultured Sphingomonas sp. TaxID=158754 RepID=UPI00262343F2|nr:hypothetical protein [uncultured Sphingomonas sp.]
MTSEQERLAEALAIERIHGEGAALYVAERIGALVVAGEADGVERFREIAAVLDRLQRPGNCTRIC